LVNDRPKLMKRNATLEKKNSRLSISNRSLNHQLQMEKKASRKLIQLAMTNAKDTMEQALFLMDEADQKKLEVENSIIEAKEQHRKSLAAERQFQSRASGCLKDKLEGELKQQQSKHVSTFEQLKVQHKNNTSKLKQKLEQAECKIADQRHSWQDRLATLSAKLSKSQSRVGKEGVVCRRMMQRQIDASLAREEEMQNLINNMEELNKDIAGDWDAEKKAKKAAVKSLKIANEKSEKRLEHFRNERQAKNEIKYELTRVLKAKAAQEEALNHYWKMTEDMKVSRKELKKRERLDAVGVELNGRYGLFNSFMSCL